MVVVVGGGDGGGGGGGGGEVLVRVSGPTPVTSSLTIPLDRQPRCVSKSRCFEASPLTGADSTSCLRTA